MIFIHGGAFQSGSNYDARLYNGTSFALLENIGFVDISTQNDPYKVIGQFSRVIKKFVYFAVLCICNS